MRTVMGIEDISRDEYYEGKMVIIKPDFFKLVYREAKYQLVKAYGGFGCDPEKLGTCVFVQDTTGEQYRTERYEILGVATDEAIAAWEQAYGKWGTHNA